jgi:hypothetical protein
MSINISLSEIDTARFGFITAKCFIDQTSDLVEINKWCLQNQVKFLIARTRSDDLRIVQSLEDNNFRLMDVLVYFERAIESSELVVIDVPAGYMINYNQRPDAVEMERMAELAFKNYIGHYHADSRLPSSQADAVYSSWAANSAAKSKIANQIISIYKESDIDSPKLVAFATLNYKNSQCEGVLFAVHPEHRQKGLHRLLVRSSIFCASQHECKSLISSTQLNNLMVQRNWVREGFLPCESFYTFHQWR